jgi:hypothetical protein
LSASHKFKIAKLVAGSSLEDKWSVWSAPSPKVEAQALLKLVRFNGSTVETIRELIDIPAETEEYFRSFVADHPEEESPIERVIEFRKRVREEFDRLVRESEKRLMAPSCENAIIIPEGNDAKGESRGLEDLFVWPPPLQEVESRRIRDLRDSGQRQSTEGLNDEPRCCNGYCTAVRCGSAEVGGRTPAGI